MPTFFASKDTWKAFSMVDLCVLIFPLVIGLTSSPTHVTNTNFTVDIPSTTSTWQRENRSYNEWILLKFINSSQNVYRGNHKRKGHLDNTY